MNQWGSKQVMGMEIITPDFPLPILLVNIYVPMPRPTEAFIKWSLEKKMHRLAPALWFWDAPSKNAQGVPSCKFMIFEDLREGLGSGAGNAVYIAALLMVVTSIGVALS